MCEVTSALTMYPSSLRWYRLVAESPLFSDVTAERITNEPTNLQPGRLCGRLSAGCKILPLCMSVHLKLWVLLVAAQPCNSTHQKILRINNLPKCNESVGSARSNTEQRAQLSWFCQISVLSPQHWIILAPIWRAQSWLVSSRCNAASGDVLMVLSVWWRSGGWKVTRKVTLYL